MIHRFLNYDRSVDSGRCSECGCEIEPVQWNARVVVVANIDTVARSLDCSTITVESVERKVASALMQGDYAGNDANGNYLVQLGFVTDRGLPISAPVWVKALALDNQPLDDQFVINIIFLESASIGESVFNAITCNGAKNQLLQWCS